MTILGTQITPEVQDGRRVGRADFIYGICLGLLVLVSRIAERGEPYFVDGPRIIASIRAGTYVIQSPGYWAFAHLGGLFRDPAAGLAFWNILFSTLGVPVFYLLCRERQPRQVVCAAAALAYGFVYFVWFAGEIHSSYASQILFPPLAILSALRWERSGRLGWVAVWSLASAAGFALRPSDGVFLLPLWLYLLARSRPPLKVWMIFLSIQMACFLGWYIPTQHALAASGTPGSGSLILLSMHTVSPLFNGINARSLANTARVVVPTVVAFGVLLPAVFTSRSTADTRLALVWLIPGLLFFLLCYIADPHYMICICGSWVWLAVTSQVPRRALACLLLCAVLNAAIFLAARPLRDSGTGSQLVNFYVVKYCRYGIQHQWSSTLGGGRQVPGL